MKTIHNYSPWNGRTKRSDWDNTDYFGVDVDNRHYIMRAEDLLSQQRFEIRQDGCGKLLPLPLEIYVMVGYDAKDAIATVKKIRNKAKIQSVILALQVLMGESRYSRVLKSIRDRQKERIGGLETRLKLSRHTFGTTDDAPIIA